MNVKLLVGIVLFVIGLIAAVGGIAGVGQPTQPSIVVEENKSQYLSDGSAWMALPWIAGLSLAVGGLLIGLSMGSFKHPRTNIKPGDEVVNPEGYHKMKHV